MAWSDEVDAIIDGDLTAGLAYVTPAGGVVVTAVAPIGLRDRAAGTVGFTTSLGFGKKLERIKRNPKVALAYHAREHGFAVNLPEPAWPPETPAKLFLLAFRDRGRLRLPRP